MDKNLVYILTEKENLNNRLNYTINSMFNFLGLRYLLIPADEIKQANPGRQDNLCIYCGKQIDAFKWCDLVIPLEDYARWLKGEIKVAYLADLPVLYVQNQPKFFVQGNILGFDLINSIFYLLSRQEEQLIPERDQWGRFPSNRSSLSEHGIIHQPIIDYYIKELKSLLQSYAEKRKLQVQAANTWKDNKKFTVALTHDVDFLNLYDFRYGVKLIKSSLKNRLNGFLGGGKHIIGSLKRNFGGEKDPLWTIEQLMHLEDSFGLRSTFFFSSQVTEPNLNDPFYKIDDEILFRNKKRKISEIVKYMEREGWEIGLHGSIDSLYKDNLFMKEKEYLANVLDKNKLGNRQHFLRLDTASCWTIFEKAGLFYDSSLGYIDRLGYRAGTGYPFFAYDLKVDRPSNILEFPLVFVEGILEAQGHLDEEEAFKMCLHYIEQAENTGGMLNILWHTHNLYRRRCKINWNSIYRRVLEELSKKDVWIAPLGEIAQWWLNREQVLNNQAFVKC